MLNNVSFILALVINVTACIYLGFHLGENNQKNKECIKCKEKENNENSHGYIDFYEWLKTEGLLDSFEKLCDEFLALDKELLHAERGPSEYDSDDLGVKLVQREDLERRLGFYTKYGKWCCAEFRHKSEIERAENEKRANFAYLILENESPFGICLDIEEAVKFCDMKNDSGSMVYEYVWMHLYPR